MTLSLGLLIVAFLVVILVRVSALHASLRQAEAHLVDIELALIATGATVRMIDQHTTPPPEPEPGTVAAELHARLTRLESGRALLRARLAARGVTFKTPKGKAHP